VRESEFLIETSFRTFRVRVACFAASVPGAASAAAARLFGSELAFGLASGSPELIQVAQQLHHALLESGPFSPRALNASADAQRFIEQLQEFLGAALEAGRLVVETEVEVPPPAEKKIPRPKVPEQARSTRQPSPLETSYEVRYVDEVDQAIAGLAVEYSCDGKTTAVTTNAAGVALLDGATSSSATIKVTDFIALAKIVEPRWDKVRSGVPPRGLNVVRKPLVDFEALPLSVKPVVANVVVITPPLGKLWVELRQADGQKLHANASYTIAGPEPFSGTTDEAGRLLHEDVARGDYALTLTVEKKKLSVPLVVLESGEPAPQVRCVGATPAAQMVSLRGFFFDKNKSLPLPGLLAAVQRTASLFASHGGCELLVVGHTDTTGDSAVNDPLSLDRATCVASLLAGKVDDWLAKYDAGVAAKHRWNESEDQVMIDGLPGFDTKPVQEDSIHWFQRTRALKVDGISGPKTRRQLITEYMALADVSVVDLEIRVTAHGCGENFPLDDSGENLDAAPADDKEDVLDRRIELFFFDRDFGILPAVPGSNSKKGSTAYKEWRKNAQVALEEHRPRPELELTLKSPSGELLANTEVRIMQGDTIIGTRRTDAVGTVRVSGHDPSQPCEVIVLGGAPLVTSGGRAHDDALAIDEPKAEKVIVLEGCEFDEPYTGEVETSHHAE